jgi:peptidoglycan/LPS O-acetylase OafA/YrhL
VIEYRREIDGLRAIAVVPVVLFHAGYQAFGTGFFGVDIFFAISGYLITSLIVADVRAGQFSFARFYERRARRILPALFVVMIACIPCAWLWMLPDEFENFGQSLVATSIFANNILLFLTSGYFSLAAEFKPLLHTWSLGVEEQYYLLYPLLLVLLLARLPRRAYILLAIAAAASLLLGSTYAANDPNRGFFFLQSRLWELLAGGLAAMLPRSAQEPRSRWLNLARGCMALAGLALILYALLSPNAWEWWPAQQQMLAVAGTILLLVFARKETHAGRLLGHPVLVGIGLVSYSFYLWHQPLLAFLRLASIEEPGPYQLFAAVVTAFALAVATWFWVEKPARAARTISSRSVWVGAVAGTFLLCASGLVIHFAKGFPARWPAGTEDLPSLEMAMNDAYNHRPMRFLNRTFNDPAKPNLLVIGNSFARDFINAGVENGYFSRVEISYREDAPYCVSTGEFALNARLLELLDQADIVVFGSPSIVRRCWAADYRILSRGGTRPVVVLGPKEFGWYMGQVMRMQSKGRYDFRARPPAYILEQNAAYRATVGDNYVDLVSMLSDSEGRVPLFTDRKKVLSPDRRHLTQDGARFVGTIIFEHPLLAKLK